MKQIAIAAVLAATLGAGPAAAHVTVPGLDVNGQCVGDADSNGQVAINELITAVNNALNGCSRLPITLTFQGQVGNQAFACGTIYTGVGTGSSQFIPSDFRFYVSNVKLVTAAGDTVAVDLDQDGVWQYQNVALLDFEDGTGPCANGNPALNKTVTGSAPAGVYTSVQFDLGIPFALDHADASTAPAPLNFTDLFWSWQAGYKFMRVDTADDKFRIHLGSTGCDGTSPSHPPTTCSHPNLATVTLPGFNVEHSVIVADLGALLSDSNLDMNQPNTPPGCMSDPDDEDCAPVFHNFGLTFPGGQPINTQKFFRLVSDTAAGGHLEIGVAANAPNGGKLFPHEDFDITQPFPVPFNECFGGTGTQCDGGMQLFTTVNPGFVAVTEAEPEESSYPLADGTPVTLVLTAVDSGLTFTVNDTMLGKAGDSVSLGQSPITHADVSVQLLLPSGSAGGTFSATFQFTTTSGQYQNSDPFTIKYSPTD
jgi:uncharacterized repeat protein (TIGR04052 family)